MEMAAERDSVGSNVSSNEDANSQEADSQGDVKDADSTLSFEHAESVTGNDRKSDVDNHEENSSDKFTDNEDEADHGGSDRGRDDHGSDKVSESSDKKEDRKDDKSTTEKQNESPY